jgi:hypothetical protein
MGLCKRKLWKRSVVRDHQDQEDRGVGVGVKEDRGIDVVVNIEPAIRKFGAKEVVTQRFNRNGELDCEDGPAIAHADGTISWWRNGFLHREDGPAIVTADGLEEWWHNGVDMSAEEFVELKRKEGIIYQEKLHNKMESELLYKITF